MSLRRDFGPYRGCAFSVVADAEIRKHQPFSQEESASAIVRHRVRNLFQIHFRIQLGHFHMSVTTDDLCDLDAELVAQAACRCMAQLMRVEGSNASAVARTVDCAAIAIDVKMIP